MKPATRVTMVSLSLALAATIAGILWAASPSVSTAEARAVDDADDADSKECPGPYVAIPMRDSAHGVLAWQVRHVVEIAADISPVPEYHDCQRFVKTKFLFFKSYDALYAVFAARDLDSQTFAPTNGSDTNVAYVAAEVYTKLGTYKHLGIRRGFNCLYLSQANGWEAFMVWAGPENDWSCKPTLSTEQRQNARKLPVHRTTYPSKELEYPAVTRWDRGRDGKYYITMKCGEGWCDVGLKDPDKRSPALAADGATGAALQRRTIRGWYDQQVLAIPSGLNVKPQSVVGTVIPEATLGDAEFALNTEVRVATIEIGNIPQYQSKLGLREGKNELFLVRTGATDTNWIAYMGQSTDPNRKRLRVTRHGHEGEGFKIPGTVRWRWVSKDETIWVRCSLGCCQVQEDQIASGVTGPPVHSGGAKR